MIKEQYQNIDKDVISLLKEFISDLQIKLKGVKDTSMLVEANKEIERFPLAPEQNVFVSFNYEHNIYYVSYSDRLIELTNYLEDWFEDEQGNKSDFTQIKEYVFRYELDGHIEVNGSVDQFRVMLLRALKNVKISEIDISDEE